MSRFHFVQPLALAALALAPLFAALILWADRRRRAALAGFSSAPLKLTLNRRMRAAKRAMLLASIVLLAIALARPALQNPDAPPPEAGDIVFLLDVSRSMFTRDAKPSRLAQAKAIAATIASTATARWPGERVSLIAFAGTTAVLCPLTVDGDYFRETLDGAGRDSVTYGGSRISDALHFALRYGFDDVRRGAKDLILLTDGGDQSGPNPVSKEFVGSGVRLSVIGVGNPLRDSPVPVSETSDEPFRYLGSVVTTHLETEELRRFGGAYFEAGVLTPSQLLDHVAVRGAAPVVTSEIYPFLLVAAIILLTVEACVTDRAKLRAPAVARAKNAAALFVFVALGASQLSAESAAGWTKSAQEAFAARDYVAASEFYAHAARIEPASAAIRFNMGVARYRSGNFEAAENAFRSAAEYSHNAQVKAKSLLGAGNAEYRMALTDPTKSSVAEMESAIASYTEALENDPKLEDAKHNLEIAKQKLEEMKRQRREGAANVMAQASMRKQAAASESAEAIVKDSKGKQTKKGNYQRGPGTDW
jgi:Ca-activated chloride channel family protein